MRLPLSAFLRYTSRQREAAKQMWAAIRRGGLYEIPVSFTTDDNTMKALMLMCEQHPEVALAKRANSSNTPLIVLQSRGIVVGLRSAMQIGSGAAQTLENFGYMPGSNGGLEALFQKHETFIRTNARITPAEAVRQAQAEDAERNRVVLPEPTSAEGAVLERGAASPAVHGDASPAVHGDASPAVHSDASPAVRGALTATPVAALSVSGEPVARALGTRNE